MKTLKQKNEFLSRHLGPREHEIPEMLNVIGVRSVDELIDQTIPEIIRSKKAFTDFVELAERKEKLTGQPCHILASY